MGNFGDKRNAEGYSDPTPYQAIKGMVKPGEVWMIRDKSGEDAEVLVIAVNDDVCNIVYLRDEYKENNVECVGSDVKFFNPRMMNWTWSKYMTKFIRKLDIKEFAEISMEIEKVLAVKISREAVITVNPNEVDAMKAELNVLRVRVQEYEKIVLAKSDELSMARIDASKYRSQLEMMKGMYNDLMEKFLQRA